MLRVSHPLSHIPHHSDIPARRNSRAAFRRRSWTSRPATPTRFVARFQ